MDGANPKTSKDCTGLEVVSCNGVGSLTRNRGRLLEEAARKRFRALLLWVEKRGDGRIMKQNMAK
jgi:hypothetical protein